MQELPSKGKSSNCLVAVSGKSICQDKTREATATLVLSKQFFSKAGHVISKERAALQLAVVVALLISTRVTCKLDVNTMIFNEQH